MNKIRRAEIRSAIDTLNDLRDQVDRLETEEEDSFYNLPEGLQASDRGSKMEDAYGYLSEALDSIDSAIEALENAAQ